MIQQQNYLLRFSVLTSALLFMGCSLYESEGSKRLDELSSTSSASSSSLSSLNASTVQTKTFGSLPAGCSLTHPIDPASSASLLPDPHPKGSLPLGSFAWVVATQHLLQLSIQGKLSKDEAVICEQWISSETSSEQLQTELLQLSQKMHSYYETL